MELESQSGRRVPSQLALLLDPTALQIRHLQTGAQYQYLVGALMILMPHLEPQAILLLVEKDLVLGEMGPEKIDLQLKSQVDLLVEAE
jgi:hypothetical protein